MTALAMTVACATAAVLLWAALEKARDPEPAAASIRALGLPAARPLGIALIAAEIIVAMVLLFSPGSAVAQGGIVVLATCFAAAGARALLLDHPVACHCFGPGGGVLGKRQLVALIPWLAGAALLRIVLPTSLPLTSGAVRMAAVAFVIAVVQSIRLGIAFRQARSDRRSAEEMYTWLPSH